MRFAVDRQIFLERKKDTEIATTVQQTPIKDPRVSYALTFGTISLVLGFLLSGGFSIIAIMFGVIAIFNGIKIIKTPAKNKAVLGATFGLLGFIFGVISLAQMGIIMHTFNNINEKYEEQFALVLPKKEPDAFVFYFAQDKDHSFKVNQFHYKLKEDEFYAVLESQDWNEPYETSSLVPSFIVREYELDTIDSNFVFISNIEEGFFVPDLEEQEDYEFSIIIIDGENQTLTIYEVWK